MDVELLIKFGNKVKAERQKRQLSQEQFAEKAGVHRTYIGMIERAEKNITLSNIAKIAAAFEMNIEELFKDVG